MNHKHIVGAGLVTLGALAAAAPAACAAMPSMPQVGVGNSGGVAGVPVGHVSQILGELQQPNGPTSMSTVQGALTPVGGLMQGIPSIS